MTVSTVMETTAAPSTTVNPICAAPFRTQVDFARVGSMTVARVRGVFPRTSREVHRVISAERDRFAVVLHRSGTAQVAQDDRRFPARAGDLVALDTGRPYELSVTGACDVVVVELPHGMLGANADLVGRYVATPQRCDRGAWAVLAAFLSSLGDRINGLTDMPDVHLADALVSLVVAAFAEPAPESADIGDDLTDRILAHTLANLGDPTLSVDSAARHHGISPRYLHQLFRRRGLTFAAWVRRERLIRIRRDLLDPALATRTTAVIAAHWGIRDHGHLSRALKKEFGLTAAELRLMARGERQNT
ncbi:helix-turn-helix domain-containing protein [Actinoallomurus sp. NBC_01490]|uniref:AraC-like ligand-binding domain-containing protein n=1 Tax=Actinoallomurus sp. NBC_01490 TaxID=2903557 RepID=UPI002E2FEC6E|nr:helix-turn-helix domain-containing protein [Actinoallomurus sp. NBC_01490]